MEDNIVRVEYEGKEILLIPTAHVSQQSVELVRRVIDEEKPDSVCIELDEQRYQNMQDPEAWKKTDIVKVIKSKRIGFLLANLILSSYQKRMAEKLGTNVGGEMVEGIRSANEIGATIVLADRNIQTTFLRIWRKLGFIEKMKLVASLLFSTTDDSDVSDEELQKMLQEDMLESVLSDVKAQFPKVGEILITERDQYLANKIKNAPGQKIVAVLGGAHVPGVKTEIFKEQDMAEISEVPAKKKISKIVGWIIPAIIIGLLAYAFINNIQEGFRQLSVWVIWNGALAAIFTAVSLGHPITIITAFLAAPFTSLNPFLACGWFAGLVEATIRKPTVEDVHNIQQDVTSIKGFFRNRFLKTIMIVIMANLGSTIGTFIAGTDIIRNLF